MRRLLSVVAAGLVGVGLTVVPASPAAASHPCHVEQPCEGHWCFGLSGKPPFIFYPC